MREISLHKTSPHSASRWMLLLSLLCILGSTVRAHATVEYARKEGKACLYCHVSGSPSYIDPKTGIRESNALNSRGEYYRSHNHSFAGYVDPNPANKSAPALFTFLWKEDLHPLARRAAVADVTGDGKPRLITLSEIPDRKDVSTLQVLRWDGKAFVSEFTGEAKAPADKLEVGQFAGDSRPAVILTQDALWTWNGATFVRKPAAHPLALFGSTRLKDGDERVLLADKPEGQAMAYHVDPQASGADWLTGGIEAPTSAGVTWGTMQQTPEFLDRMGLPALLSAGGLVGLWDVQKSGSLLLYYAKIDQDFDIKPDPNDKNRPQIALRGKPSSYVVFRNPYEATGLEFWSTPRMLGLTYDVARIDPKDGKMGLLALTSESPDGKGRSLYFFTPLAQNPGGEEQRGLRAPKKRSDGGG